MAHTQWQYKGNSMLLARVQLKGGAKIQPIIYLPHAMQCWPTGHLLVVLFLPISVSTLVRSKSGTWQARAAYLLTFSLERGGCLVLAPQLLWPGYTHPHTYTDRMTDW